MRKMTLALVIAPLLLLAGQAAAGTLFDNFPIEGTVDAWDISLSGGFSISNSFTLPTAGTATGVNFGVWAAPGDLLTQVDWSIGTSAFASDISSGTASVTSQFEFSNGFGYNIYLDSFVLPGVSLGTGPYYLTLLDGIINGNSNNGDGVYWDENGGAGVDAWQNSSANGLLHITAACPDIDNNGTCAESFQILDTSSVPEPASLTLYGMGMLLLAGTIRRKLNR